MLEKKDLIIDKLYRCKITTDYAKSQDQAEWGNKIVTLKFTGLWLRSLKDEFRIFAISDVVVIEEVL